jgi:hypothetical protein
VHVLSVSVRGFRRRGQLVQVLVQVLLRDGRASAMFLVA